MPSKCCISYYNSNSNSCDCMDFLWSSLETYFMCRITWRKCFMTSFFLYCRFLLGINFIHISVYMSIPIAQFSTPPSPPHRSFAPLVSICLFSTSVSQLLPCKPAHLYHFSRFHLHALIYDICFSLSDLLHSV